MPPLRPLILDALAVTMVAAALAVMAAGYVRNFPDTPTGDIARADDWTDPTTTGSIEPKAGDGGGADGTAAEQSDARPSRPGAVRGLREWTDPPRRSVSSGSSLREAPGGTPRQR